MPNRRTENSGGAGHSERRKSAIVIRESRVEGLSLNGSKADDSQELLSTESFGTSMSTHHILGLKKVPRNVVRQFGSYLPLVLKGELRGANPSTRGLGWANLWCTGCYANSSAGLLSWYGRTAAPREILLYTSSRTRFLNRTSIGERCKHREV
ncbi:hypothetical protein CR513_02839, partial [Mucuna pruriens]